MNLFLLISRSQDRCLGLVSLLCCAFVFACDDGTSDTVDVPTADTTDASTDMGSDSASDASGEGAADSSVDDGDTPEEDTMPPAREDLGGACNVVGDCKRGLTCLDGRCAYEVGCALDDSDASGEGCLMEDRGGGLTTVAECVADEECASADNVVVYCVRQVCTRHAPCVSDADCADPESCYQMQICLPPV